MDCYINTGPFSVFCDREKEHWLVLSGIGQINSASATTYLSEISDAPPWAGWINIGIAGYRGKKTEDLLLVDEVQQFSTGHTLYPGPIIGNDLQRYSLITVDKPSKNYKQGHLVDMEGYAFFEIASRLSSQQLTIILKIISDGPDEPLELIKPETVTESISRIINNLKTLQRPLNAKALIIGLLNNLLNKGIIFVELFFKKKISITIIKIINKNFVILY